MWGTTTEQATKISTLLKKMTSVCLESLLTAADCYIARKCQYAHNDSRCLFNDVHINEGSFPAGIQSDQYLRLRHFETDSFRLITVGTVKLKYKVKKLFMYMEKQQKQNNNTGWYAK